MKFKTLLNICIVALIVCVTTSIGFASGSGDDIKKLLQQDSIEYSLEKNEVLDALEKAESKINRLLGQTNKKSTNMYKIYVFNGDTGKYRKSGNFGSLISGNYMWEVPIYDNKGQIISSCLIDKGPYLSEVKKSLSEGVTLNEDAEKEIKKFEGKWHMIQLGLTMPIEGMNFVSNRDKIVDLLNQNGIKPNSIKLVSTPYSTYLLYIKDANQEYGIPFATREDFVGVRNGTLYTMPELMVLFQKFENSLKQSVNNEGEMMFGGYIGGDVKSPKNNTNSTLIILLTAVITLLVIISIYFKFKKRLLV